MEDFYWSKDREPHYGRRMEIMKKYPEVKKLFGIDKSLKFSAILLVATQVAIAYYSKDIYDYSIWAFIAVAYLVGAFISQALFLAIHEITHDLAFKNKEANNWLAYVANIPIVFPFAMAFKQYHAKHHWDQGKDGIDTDIPSNAETKIFKGFFGKIIWTFIQILFYALRPMMVHPLKYNRSVILNIIFQVVVMSIIIPLVGWSGLGYFLLSCFFAGSIHPIAAHFISEHYVFTEGQETYSYYGPLNLLTYNVGYHNEHHDFPNIPGSKLPQLKKTAPEFYDSLKSYSSWTMVLVKFLFTKNITLFSRTKRA